MRSKRMIHPATVTAKESSGRVDLSKSAVTAVTKADAEELKELHLTHPEDLSYGGKTDRRSW